MANHHNGPNENYKNITTINELTIIQSPLDGEIYMSLDSTCTHCTASSRLDQSIQLYRVFNTVAIQGVQKSIQLYRVFNTVAIQGVQYCD